MPVEPRDAATVMLLRNVSGARGGVEVLMVRRHGESRFVPGAYVFPGGRVEEADCSPTLEEKCAGIDRSRAWRMIPDAASGERSLGAWVAGIRETFEEVGILFGCGADGSILRTEEHAGARFERYRRRLHAGSMSLGEILDREQLRLAAGRLLYFAHWITPEASAIRYDVRFFVAEAPSGQAARPDGVELTDHRWVEPGQALADHEDGDFPLVLPTRAMLTELAAFRTVEQVLDSAVSKRIPAILSKIVVRNGEPVEVMPEPEVAGGALLP